MSVNVFNLQYGVKAQSMEKTDQTFKLDGPGIEQCSELLEERMLALGVRRKRALQIRFALEEALLRFRDQLGEDREFRLLIRNSFGTAYA